MPSRLPSPSPEDLDTSTEYSETIDMPSVTESKLSEPRTGGPSDSDAGSVLPTPSRSAPSATGPPPPRLSHALPPDGDKKNIDLSHALLTSVATTNISTLQQGLAKQTTYWSGVAWIASALSQRIEGIQDIDLVNVTEKLESFVSLPDAGIVGQSNLNMNPDSALGGMTMSMATAQSEGFSTGFTPGDWGGTGFDLSSLPFDYGSIEAQNVIEQDVPLPSSWF
jgi:hypothetical protein